MYHTVGGPVSYSCFVGEGPLGGFPSALGNPAERLQLDPSALRVPPSRRSRLSPAGAGLFRRITVGPLRLDFPPLLPSGVIFEAAPKNYIANPLAQLALLATHVRMSPP